MYEVLHSKVNLFSFFTVNPTYRPVSSNIYEHATKKLTDVLTTSAEETIRGKLFTILFRALPNRFYASKSP